MGDIQIGLIGFGTVGTGVAKILTDNAELIRARLGAGLILKKVADIDLTTDRGIHLAPGILTDDAGAVVNDPDIDIVVEMIGGKDTANELIMQAIANGKHVVTANKALLAERGNAIFQAAAQKGVDIAYEASTGGCMPIIKTLRESLVGNQIRSMTGILNGTCNYILTKITDEGTNFAEALDEAQRQGYAEADPTLDIDGHDTAHKLAILSSLAYGMELNLGDIYIEGISRITPLDIQFADQFGYRIKLLAIGKNRGDAIEARVHPTMIPFDNLLSKINGRVNAMMISADAVDDIMLYGYGAGMMPTGSAVVSDCVDLARNIMSGNPQRVPLLSFQLTNISKIPIKPIEEIETHYYFRFSAVDRPGVLSTIAGVLGNHGISIKSVHQKGRKSGGTVPVVMLTHLAKEVNVTRALNEIGVLDVVSDQPAFIRIEDDNGQDWV